MKIEDVKLVQMKLKEIEVKNINIKKIEIFLESVKDYKNLNIGTPSRTLIGSGTETFEFIGKEIIELLESKKTILEKEIHNFTLDQLLLEKEIENNGLGFKFTTERSHTEIDDGIYYYKLSEDGSSAIASWFKSGELQTVSYDQESIAINEINFISGRWAKI